eukprot:scaffold3035_cov72-Phaeocystis_antarctica.AAC.5
MPARAPHRGAPSLGEGEIDAAASERWKDSGSHSACVLSRISPSLVERLLFRLLSRQRPTRPQLRLTR